MNYWKLLYAALAALFLTACGGKEEEPSTPVTLTANPSELVFESKGGTVDLSLTSGIQPNVSCSESWISITPGAASGNSYKYSVTAKEHTGTEARTTSIRVIGDKQSLMIPVTQNVPKVSLSVDKTSVSFDRFGGIETLTVTSSTQPNVTTDAKWCGIETGKIDGSHQTKVPCPQLLTGRQRQEAEPLPSHAAAKRSVSR